METHKTKKIAVNVTKNIVIGLFLVFTALITIITISISKDLVNRELEKLTMLASQNAAIAREFMEEMISKQEVLTHTVNSLSGIEDSKRADTMERIITDTKSQNKKILSLFLVAEPNQFMANTPNGFSIFATDAATNMQPDMYKFINKELYQQAKESKKMMIVDPFEKTIDNKQYKVITIVQPILGADGEFQGLVGSNIDMQFLNNASYNNGGFSTFLMQIICGHQTVIANSRSPEIIGKKYVDVSESTNTQKILDSAKDEAPYTFLDTNTNGQQYYKSYIPFYLKGSSVVWLSGTSISKSEFDAQIIKQISFIALCLVVALFLLATLAYVRINAELRPIKQLENAVQQLAKGNLHDHVSYESNNELGSLAENLRNSTHILQAYILDIDHAMAEMANGNFVVAPSQEFVGDFKNIDHSISRFVSNMSSTLLQIIEAAAQVSAGSDQVSSGSQELAQSATEQASSVEELSAELADISSHIKSNAENAANANRLADVVGNKINTSSAQMSEMISAMSEISNSSSQISKIIKTIEDIAFQTNILALNAAVEAARAGAAGKGFAVVADEVRNLATKSSEAAKQTNMLIESSVKSVNNGVLIASETAKSLEAVVSGSQEIIALITQIAQASGEQANSITQVNLGVERISTVIQTTSATSEESAAASEELSGQANMMRTLVSKFKLRESTSTSPTPAATECNSGEPVSEYTTKY